MRPLHTSTGSQKGTFFYSALSGIQMNKSYSQESGYRYLGFFAAKVSSTASAARLLRHKMCVFRVIISDDMTQRFQRYAHLADRMHY